jgi:tRNA pseudouridine38-40 synthase
VEDPPNVQPSRRFRLTVEYEGTGFEGWQLQAPGRRTIQGELEAAIEQVTGSAARIYGAGRTDAGVHALGQVCHFDSSTALSVHDLERALNAVLADDLGVLEVRGVPLGFDARRDAIRKRYLYRVLNRAAPSPLRHRWTWHIRRPLELERMERAAAFLVGDHDFESFRGAPAGPPPPESTVRKLERLEVSREEDEVHLVAEGRSFLRYMVRNLVGTLVEVGLERREPEEMPGLVEGRSRALSGPTAPARGLYLVRIVYPGDPVSCPSRADRLSTRLR